MKKLGPQNRTGVWVIDRFDAGISDGSKRGPEGSFRAGIGTDYRTDPDIITSNKKMTKISGAEVNAAPHWHVEHGTDTYVYLANGKFIKYNSSHTASTIATISDSHGNGMAVFDDYIYLASDKGLHRYGPLSNSPALETDFLVSVANEIDVTTGVLATNTYTLTTAINEGATHKYTFTAGVDNISGIAVRLITVGTGDWTFTVHNASNAIVAQRTIANADLPAADSTFRVLFSGIYDLTVAGSYHLHIHSTVADGTVRTSTASDLATAEFASLQYADTEDVDQSSEPTVELKNAFSTATTISEASTSKQEFTPDRSNISGISIMINAGGTSADWTVTLHDDQDTLLGSKTIASANLKLRGGYQKFEFSSPIKVEVGATYHFHVTTSVTTGTPSLFSATASDLNAAYFRTHYQILENDENWHPITYFPGAAGIAIGNGNFVALYDGITYRDSGPFTGSERLKLPLEESVRGLEVMGDHLQVGTWKGDTIDDHGSSRLYFWDGTSPTYTSFKDIIGEFQASKFGQDGLLRIIHGQGLISIFDGGLTLIKEMPNIGENKYVDVYPGAITNWNGLTLFGISGGTSTTCVRAVYSHGAKMKNYPMSLSCDYPISTGTTSSNAQITSLLGLGPTKLYVGWADNSTYGIDKIDTSSDQASVTYETLIFDAGVPYFEKKASAIKLTCRPLASGQTITVEYKLDHQSSWDTLGTASYATNGAITSKSFPFDERFKELELQITLATSGTDGPKLTSLQTFIEIVADVQET
jgi:hypothetical protein